MRSAVTYLTVVFLSFQLILHGMVAVSLAPPGCQAAEQADEAGGEDRRLGEIDVYRIRMLHHITDTFGDRIWPNFDTRKIPVAINNHDREELLAGHPNPPRGFRPFEAYELDERPVMIRDGVTCYGPDNGGWAVTIAGEKSSYVSVKQPGRDTEDYLSIILHECFHCYQDKYRESTSGSGNHPEDDPVYGAKIGLESRTLKAAVEADTDEEVRHFAKMFVAVRHDRRKGLPQHLVILEGEREFSEGTATYVQARMCQLIAAEGGLEPVGGGEDPDYHGFTSAKQDYETMVAGIVLPEAVSMTFFHSMYKHGMAQCLVLDRIRPDWKNEIREKGVTQFTLLEREFPLDEDSEEELLAESRKRFDYDTLSKQQKKAIEQRLDLIRGYVHAKGRRYRIHHGRIRGKFDWKPEGPVYRVPASIEAEAEETGQKKDDLPLAMQAPKVREDVKPERIIWVGGIQSFEKQGLTFRSGTTPVIFSQDYLEWIDTDPAPDDSDMTVDSASQRDGTYVDAKIVTGGFTLEASKVRIEWSRDVVDVYPSR